MFVLAFSVKSIERHYILDPKRPHEKKFETHKIPTRKSFQPMKYQRKKNRNLPNTQERKKFFNCFFLGQF